MATLMAHGRVNYKTKVEKKLLKWYRELLSQQYYNHKYHYYSDKYYFK